MGDSKKEIGPPPKLSFKQFLWNSETSQCLGRTGSSWAKILIFYVIFYAGLAAFFAGLLAVFFQTLQENQPKWKMTEGLIGNNPGLGFRPMPPESNVESTLIWYDASKENQHTYWVDEIENFINAYKAIPTTNQQECTFEHGAEYGKVCKTDFNSFGSCNKDNKYGYGGSSPCVFLKLNKIYDWKPAVYSDAKNLPDKMPKSLKENINQVTSLKPNETNIVWVSCEGENPADNENIKSIDYYPRMGFPGFFFPYKNVEGYTPPLVAVQFSVQTGVLINVECKAWAHNIHHDRSERRGSVHFEIMVD
ncbi:ATP1B1.2 family protein [Megaselia abdita]